MRVIRPALLSLLPLTGLFAATATASMASAEDFAPCADSAEHALLAGSRCAHFEVPLYHDQAASDRTLTLFVRRYDAEGEARGQIWFLAGGPGEAGASYYPAIDFFRSEFSEYDLIIPDHRGTGYSAKLCEPEETAESEGGLALAGAEWGSCFGQLYGDLERAHAFNSFQAAHDLDALRAANRGNGEQFIYAVSYGTGLALQHAAITHQPLDGIILDSLVAHAGHADADLSRRSAITDRIGTVLIERCAAAAACPLGEDALAQYQSVLSRIDAGEDLPGMEQVPGGNLRQLLGLMLDIPAARARIPAIIHALSEESDTAGPLITEAIAETESLFAPFSELPQGTASIPLVAMMAGSESNGRPGLTADTVAAEQLSYRFTSPLAGFLADTQFPLYERPPLAVADTLPPVLVLQGTLDPKTPYEAALEHVQTWQTQNPVAILTLNDAPHAAYLTAQDCLAGPLSRFVSAPEEVQNETCGPSASALPF